MNESDLIEALGYADWNHISVRQLAREIEEERSLVPFIGAGLSQPHGFRGWTSFLLDLAVRTGKKAIVGSLVASGQYEEAAQVVRDALGPALDDAIHEEYGEHNLRAGSLHGAVTMLPELFAGPVVTTNFDRVLERTYQEAGVRMGVYWGASTDSGVRALREHRPVLLKLHGDCDDCNDRVLTAEEYEKHYGSLNPGQLDLTRPLPYLLSAILLQGPVLFLGCSLTADRTVQVVQNLAKHARGMWNYAVVEAPRTRGSLLKRARFLAECGIRPVWYPRGQHERVEQVLGFLCEVRNSVRAPPVLTHPEAQINLDSVRDRAAEARAALRPSILKQIGRPHILAQMTSAIEDRGGRPIQTVSFVTGPAGCGKSTLLGELYDELSRRPGTWVGLARSEDLQVRNDGTGLDEALGLAVTGSPVAMTAAARRLQAGADFGFILIDTLDLILSSSLVPHLRDIVARLTQVSGVALVITCRDHDLDTYLKPLHARLPGLGASQLREVPVPPFDSGEVRRAAIAYLRASRNLPSAGGAARFAQKVVRLSADSRPISEITHNPLLLSLLCDLFSRDGVVPDDLTVSKLYGTYWTQKVLRGRRSPQDTGERLAAEGAREGVCLLLARTLYEASRERLFESADRERLVPSRDPVRAAVLLELQSENIIVPTPGHRVRFFHQTFEEYAIAVWLAGMAREAERSGLLNGLAKGPGTGLQHWWPTACQLLTLLDEAEFQHWLTAVADTSSAAYRAFCLATVARTVSQRALNELCEIAVAHGGDYVAHLLEALDMAPRSATAECWVVACSLMKGARSADATRVAVWAGERLARNFDRNVFRSMVSLLVGRVRSKPQDARVSEVAGKFVGAYAAGLGRGAPAPARKVLRAAYSAFGDDTREQVIQLHLRHQLTGRERDELLKAMRTAPLPVQERDAATKLILECQLNGGTGSVEETWVSWLALTGQKSPGGWNIAEGKAMGMLSARDERLIEQLALDVCAGPDHRLGATIIALQEAISQGSKVAVLTQLDALQPKPCSSGRGSAMDYIRRAASRPVDGSGGRRRREVAGRSVSELLDMVNGKLDRAAARRLVDMIGDNGPSAEDFLVLLRSRTPGVRYYGLEGLSQLNRRSGEVTRDQMHHACNLLAAETVANVVVLQCKLMGQWSARCKRAEQWLVTSLRSLHTRLALAGTYDNGVARYTIEALNSISRHADAHLLADIGDCLLDILASTNLQYVGNSGRIVGPLKLVAQVHPTYLRDILTLAEGAPELQRNVANLCLIADAIRVVEGSASSVLDDLLRSSWIPEQVHAHVLKFRGLK